MLDSGQFKRLRGLPTTPHEPDQHDQSRATVQHSLDVQQSAQPDRWAADTLAQAGATVHLAHPLGVKMFTYRRVKNDERDAADLADLLRMGRLPESWIAPPEIRGLRELVRYRHKLVGIRTSCKDQIHAVLAKCGVFVPMADVFGAAGQLTSRRSGDLRDCVLSPRLAAGR
jgi:transposase